MASVLTCSRENEKKSLIGFAWFLAAISVLAAKNRSELRMDWWLIRTDWAISRAKSWRMRLESTDPKSPKEWIVIEAVPPDREHGWQHIDRALEEEGSKTKRIAGDLEYIRVGR